MTAPNASIPDGMFGPGGAREPHVTVADRWTQCRNLPDDHPDKTKEFLHRQLNEEMNVLENAARSLADFGDADWDIRMWLARQCADEARHAMAYQRLLVDRGGRFGEYPVLNFQYKVLGTITTLAGRLAVQNRTFEAEGLDAAVHAARQARESGDAPLAALFDAQAADEIVHVRFANDWIKRAVKKEPRTVLDIANALTRAAKAFEWVFADGGMDVTKYPVAEDERQTAGFNQAEVKVAADLSQTRRDAIARRGR